MKNKITNRKKDPLGSMMLEYLGGKQDAYVEVESTTLEMWKMSGSVMFRTFKNMNRIERKALSLCQGKILDIGSGSGCHTLYLQKKNKTVDALDISPGCIDVMKKRKINNIIHDSLFSLKNKRYHTLLMLMNGLGICGSLDGLNLFLQFSKTILADNGQILVDSTDLSVLYEPETLSVSDGTFYGETEFIMIYKDIVGDPFEWLYIDFTTLQYYAGLHGFACEKIMADKTGKFLARLSFEISS